MKILKYTLVLMLACCSQSMFADKFLNLDGLKNAIPKANIHQLRKNDLALKDNKDKLERELANNEAVWKMNKDAIVTYEAAEKSRLEEEYNAQKELYQKALNEKITNPAAASQPEGIVPVRMRSMAQ